MLYRLLITALLLTPFFASQAQQETEATSIQIKYKFNKGDQFEEKQRSQEDSYLNLNGDNQRTTNQKNTTLLFTVTAVNSIQATIEASYKQINLLSSSSDQHVSVNTSSDDNGMYNRLFKAMIGKKFTIVMQYNGTLKTITGLSPIFDQMVAAVPEVKAKERPTLKKFLQSQFGAEALKASFAVVLPYYPAREIQANGSWSNLLYTGGFYHGRIDNYWKLEYNDKYTIKLSNKGKFVTDSSEQVDLGGGQKGFVDLDGEVHGNYVIDPQTDWPSICITHTELNGNYIYLSPKKRKKNVEVPVRVVMDASYQFKHL
jgi:hypothetical protein